MWGKYRTHPTWPARIDQVMDGFAWLDYLHCDGPNIRTRLSGVTRFGGPEDAGFVDSGINSPMSGDFKLAYKEAYEEYVKRSEGEVCAPIIHLNFNNG